MRILHISTRLILGGSQENTVLSCEGQCALGHDVHLAFGPIYGPEGSMLPRVESFRHGERRITPHVVPHMVRELSPRADWLALRELEQLIAHLRPDIVHTHSSKAGILGRVAAWRVWRASRDARPAVVHTIHGPPFHKHEARWRNAIYIASEKFAARRCHMIVSVADAMTRQFLERGIGAPEQYVTVRSGMDLTPFDDAQHAEVRRAVRAQLGIAPSDIVIGTVARLAELKGHDDIIDALADDLRARPDLRLLWVGDGWWAQRLAARLESLGLQDRVTRTGLVPPERVPAMIAAMDLLVHPSYREGLPRVVPQALLSGVPVVAYDCDGTGEIVLDGRTGRLVPVGDRAALRDAVRWMLADPARARATASTGRETCRAMFSADKMVSDLEAVYARAIEIARHGGEHTNRR